MGAAGLGTAGAGVGAATCKGGSGGGGGSKFGSNSRQNRQANDAKREAERLEGKKMTNDQEDKFHDEVSHQGMGYHDMVQVAREILQGRI
jgi:hypothetical protein